MKTPTWDEVLEFPRLDGWRRDRSTGHDFYEKVLPSGEILQTHASRSGDKTISPGRFQAILRDQLKITADQFWKVLRTKEPALRPAAAPEFEPPSLPNWLVAALQREAGLSEAEIAQLSGSEARARLDQVRSRPRA